MEQLIEQLKEQWIVFVPIMGVIITASIAYLLGRPRWYAKLDEQYQKVWAPLHRLLWFSNDSGIMDPEKTQKIQGILHENYHLAPQYIIDLWQKKNIKQFCEKVFEDFEYAARRLGYTKSLNNRRNSKIFWALMGTINLAYVTIFILGHPIGIGDWIITSICILQGAGCFYFSIKR